MIKKQLSQQILCLGLKAYHLLALFINLDIPLRMIIFHIVQVNILFLLCFANIDKLRAFFNNLINKVIQFYCSHPVICQYDHTFLFWYTSTYFFITELFIQNLCYLTDIELRHLYCCFRYPSVWHLQRVLKQSRHKIELHILEHLTKYCEYCQKHR